MTNIRDIWVNQATASEKQIKTRVDSIENFRVYAGTNQITGNRLFLFEFDNAVETGTIKLSRFKGLTIQILEYQEHKELTIILLDTKLTDIFVLFTENLIKEIDTCLTEKEAIEKTANTIYLWKQLFDKIGFGGLTIEEQKGLIGELLVIDSLIDEGFEKSALIHGWTGPHSEDKDYVFNSVAVEVKLTNAKYPSIKITNERQLDDANLQSLYLVLFIANEVRDEGISLVDLILKVRNKLSANFEALNAFNDKLPLLRFYDEDSSSYTTQYVIKQRNIYRVEAEFPRITQSILQPGVQNVSYNIELSACERFRLDKGNLKDLING